MAMRSIDEMPLGRYLDVLAAAARRREAKKDDNEPSAPGGGHVVELRRGTIDEVF